MPQKAGKEFRPWQGENVNAAELKVDILAKIAQLVEHDLAKVGVAGSSPVFRSNQKTGRTNGSVAFFAQVVELVDTLL